MGSFGSSLFGERQRNFITKVHADLVFRRVSRFEVVQDTWHSNEEKILV